MCQNPLCSKCNSINIFHLIRVKMKLEEDKQLAAITSTAVSRTSLPRHIYSSHSFPTRSTVTSRSTLIHDFRLHSISTLRAHSIATPIASMTGPVAFGNWQVEAVPPSGSRNRQAPGEVQSGSSTPSGAFKWVAVLLPQGIAHSSCRACSQPTHLGHCYSSWHWMRGAGDLAERNGTQTSAAWCFFPACSQFPFLHCCPKAGSFENREKKSK